MFDRHQQYVSVLFMGSIKTGTLGVLSLASPAMFLSLALPVSILHPPAIALLLDQGVRCQVVYS